MDKFRNDDGGKTGQEAESVLPLETVNWHLTPHCNYTCRFCFYADRAYWAREVDPSKPSLTEKEEYQILKLLREAGTQRITFSGGEPTLVKNLPELIHEANLLGLSVVVVTNGTGINEAFASRVARDLDAVKISVDSMSDETEKLLGRGMGQHIEVVRKAARVLSLHEIPLMVNTVVTSLNWKEDLHDLIQELNPTRWKVFQFLPVPGENDDALAELAISEPQFLSFVAKHQDLQPVAETNDAMWESYVMLDPIGRFFQDASKGHTYSRNTVLEVGVEEALRQAGGWRRDKFVERRGRYRLPSRSVVAEESGH